MLSICGFNSAVVRSQIFFQRKNSLPIRRNEHNDDFAATRRQATPTIAIKTKQDDLTSNK